MRPRHLVPSVVALIAVAAPAAAGVTLEGRVSAVVDGDTVRVEARGFETAVRLVGIDAPETRRPDASVDCWGPEAAARTARLLPAGRRVRVVTDPTQDARDRYGRLLAYVYRDGRRTSVNLALVATGFARVYVYDPARPFRYARAYRAAQHRARAAGRGLWGPPCRGAATPRAPAPPAPGRRGCDPAYPTVCLPPPPPDLDCRDLPFRRFRVLPPDPHHLDGGGDGVACEG